MKPYRSYFNHPRSFRVLRLILLNLLVLLFFRLPSKAGITHGTPAELSAKNVFKPVYATKEPARIDLATNIYKSKCRKIPAAKAMAALDSLQGIALQLDDKSLQCAVYWFRADYYSVNNFFNPLSIRYYQGGIDFAKKNALPLETAISTHKMGMYYHTFKHNAAAYAYLLNALQMFKDIGFGKVRGISAYLNDLAVFYYDIGDFYNARIELAEALKYKPYGKREEISMINSIGLIYRMYRQYDQAIGYFKKSLQLATLSRDSAWIGIAQGNIGSVYLMKNNFEKALPYIRTDYAVSLKYNEQANAAIAMLRIVKISMHFKAVKLAKRQLDTVASLLANQPDVLKQWIDYYDLKAADYEHAGNFTAALQYRKLFETAKDSLAKRNDVQDFERMGLRRLMDMHVAQVNELQTEQKVGYVKRNAVIIVLILLVIIFVLVYNRLLLEQKKDKALLLAEKRVVDGKLKSSVSELGLYTKSIKQKNELIDKFKERLQNLQQHKSNADIIEKLIAVSVMTDNSWSEFKKLFLKVYPAFFIDLKKRFPHLTETDMKLLALIKLQLNNNDMASILGVTVEGIKKAKQRLKKKLTLPETESMDEFVTGL